MSFLSVFRYPVTHTRILLTSLCLAGLVFMFAGCSDQVQHDPAGKEAAQPNILLVLTDDHRWDALGFLGHPYLETPSLDRLAAEGVFYENAFVTTALCSPSRASILTGLYAHNHGVVDNYHPVDSSLVFFPELLHEAGYETAFIGKWHMGDSDEPQRGFDHWVAFRGQGTYYPDGRGTTRVVPQTRYDGFNINGDRVPQEGYITDELTDYAIEWLEEREKDAPFFLYLSHKAVHSDFVPADQHRGRYEDAEWTPPETFADTEENRAGKPTWLLNQRNSRHGADYGYNLEQFELETYVKRYHESLISVDENLGRMLDYLGESDQLDQTLVVYLGDNGFQFGEHGLIDKRTAYETSIRVPLIARFPEGGYAGKKVEEMVANIDIGPTLLEVGGVNTTNEMDGRSFLGLTTGDEADWRENLLYEYYWEWNYPQTPTVFAIRGEQYKYIRYHGVWDTDELYDVVADPIERHNLVRQEAFSTIAATKKRELFTLLETTGGLNMPLLPDRGRQFYYRHPERASQATFPEWFYEKPAPVVN